MEVWTEYEYNSVCIPSCCNSSYTGCLKPCSHFHSGFCEDLFLPEWWIIHTTLCGFQVCLALAWDHMLSDAMTNRFPHPTAECHMAALGAGLSPNLWELWKFCWLQSLLSAGFWKMFGQQVCWRWNTDEMGNFINASRRVSVQQKRTENTQMQKLVCLKQTKERLLKSHEFLCNCCRTRNSFFS